MYRFVAIAIFGAGMAMGANDGFVSLMPRHDVGELWTIEGTPPSAWRVENGEIVCKGTPNGFLRSMKVYRNYILRAEWRFEPEGWVGAPEKWPNAGFFIFANEIKDTWPVSLEVQGYHGEAGFRTFSHLKPVFRQARFNGAGLLNPPYGARFRRVLELLLRRG